MLTRHWQGTEVLRSQDTFLEKKLPPMIRRFLHGSFVRSHHEPARSQTVHVESGTIHSIHRQQQAKRTLNPEGLKSTWVPHLGTKIPQMRPKKNSLYLWTLRV